MPGFVDIHMHGGYGIDTMATDSNGLRKLSEQKLREGVTAYIPAVSTAPLPMMETAIQTIVDYAEHADSGAKVAGIFIEGPYINPQFKGAHPEKHIRSIDIKEMEHLIELIPSEMIVSLAIAPELNGAMEAIEYFTKKGINVRIGHSSADCDTITEAVTNGANTAIHTFNAMSGFTHREPNMVGAVLTDDRIYNEIICDFIHTHPMSVKMLYCKANQIVLITDAMCAAGLSDGEFCLGAKSVSVVDGVARTEEGALAGSTVTLLQAAKNAKNLLGLNWNEIISMSSSNPAKAVGLNNKIGSIAIGKSADLVVVNDDLDIKYVIAQGTVM
jgi:N-acetylglucosamine-6-phosphate deacetylase